MFDGISPVKLSSPVLCLARSFLYYVFTFSTSDWSLQIVFLLDLVLESCMFLEICPFLLGCPICSYYSLMIFICLWYQLLFLLVVSYFVSVHSLVFLMSLSKGLSILSIFSKIQLCAFIHAKSFMLSHFSCRSIEKQGWLEVAWGWGSWGE